ncbi:hypothetical protein C8Q76DRAFT_800768 [Earliella scabrosa]|nr:hypothetical protein C8Q76DRAFT_800768 [Earliella scabrosa]
MPSAHHHALVGVLLSARTLLLGTDLFGTQVFAALFRRGVAPRFLTWRSFLQAMGAAQFELVNVRGSTRLFVPPPQLSRARLSLIQPKTGLLAHTDQRYVALRLQELYGLDYETVLALLTRS